MEDVEITDDSLLKTMTSLYSTISDNIDILEVIQWAQDPKELVKAVNKELPGLLKENATA